MKIEDVAIWIEPPEKSNFCFFVEKAKNELLEAGLEPSEKWVDSTLERMWEEICLIASIQSKHTDNFNVRAQLRFVCHNRCYGLLFDSISQTMFIAETARFAKKPSKSGFYGAILFAYHCNLVAAEYLRSRSI